MHLSDGYAINQGGSNGSNLQIFWRTIINSQSIQQVYDRCSSFYDIFFKPWLEFGRRTAIEKLDLLPGNKVLEMGIGTGLSLEYFPEGVNVVAFDYSDGMLKHCRNKANATPGIEVDILQMDAQKMSFPEGKFDKIFAAYVMTVIPDTRMAVTEILRVAKPGAKVVFINHLRSENKFLSWFEDVFHPFFSGIGLFNLDKDLLSILDSLGITDIQIEPTSFLGLHYIISFQIPEK